MEAGRPAERWTEITRTGMIQHPHQDFAAMLDTITDAAQHALNDYTATNTVSHPDLRIPDSPPPNRPAPGLEI